MLSPTTIVLSVIAVVAVCILIAAYVARPKKKSIEDRWNQINNDEDVSFPLRPKPKYSTAIVDRYGHLNWGTYGKEWPDGSNFELTQKRLIDLESDHMVAILRTQSQIGQIYREGIIECLVFRGDHLMLADPSVIKQIDQNWLKTNVAMQITKLKKEESSVPVRDKKRHILWVPYTDEENNPPIYTRGSVEPLYDHFIAKRWENVMWPTRGKDRNLPLHDVKLIECDSHHLRAILDLPKLQNHELDPNIKKACLELLAFRGELERHEQDFVDLFQENLKLKVRFSSAVSTSPHRRAYRHEQ